MNVRKAIFILFMVPVLGATSEMAGSQSLSFSLDSTANPTNITSGGFAPSYTRPTPREKIHSFGLNTFGPIPLVVSAGSAGIDQFDNSPPEWKQGAAGYGKRFGSDLGTAVVGTTTRYALSEVFREDSLYYRCECTGIFLRVGHAAISSLTARRGQDAGVRVAHRYTAAGMGEHFQIIPVVAYADRLGHG